MNILTRKVFKILIIPPNFHLIFLRSPRQPVNPLITPEPQKDRQTLKDLVGLQAHDHRRDRPLPPESRRKRERRDEQPGTDQIQVHGKF